MNTFEIQILETVVMLILYVIAFFVTKNILDNSLKIFHLQRIRRKMIIKAINLIIFITFMIFIAAIWGLDQNEIAIFAGTIMTVLGIAFFAQWSLLSNITSSIILFFNHPLKLGDTIILLDKDYPLEGEITELTYFFIYLKTKSGETITVPNSLVLQKPFSVIENQDEK